MYPFRQCNLDTYIENDKITTVTPVPEHALKTKLLCPKPTTPTKLIYYVGMPAPCPNLKTNGNKGKASWGGAFRFVADKLQTINEKYVAKAFVFHPGNLLQERHV